MEARICTTPGCQREVHPCYQGSVCEDCLALVMNVGHKKHERLEDRAKEWKPKKRKGERTNGAR